MSKIREIDDVGLNMQKITWKLNLILMMIITIRYVFKEDNELYP